MTPPVIFKSILVATIVCRHAITRHVMGPYDARWCMAAFL